MWKKIAIFTRALSKVLGFLAPLWLASKMANLYGMLSNNFAFHKIRFFYCQHMVGWWVGGVPWSVRGQLLLLVVVRMRVTHQRTASGRWPRVNWGCVLVVTAVHLGGWGVWVIERQVWRWVVRSSSSVPLRWRWSVVVMAVVVGFSWGIEIQWLQGPSLRLPQVVWVMGWRDSSVV
jgi:hypothetical protein